MHAQHASEIFGLHDERRAVLEMTGAHGRAVLQDVVTNDVEKAVPGSAVYAALLTPQGKYLFDFFLVDAGDRILIDTLADRAPALAQRLRMYCLRRDAAIALREDLAVVLLWSSDNAPIADRMEGVDPPQTNAVPDPRDAALGWRIVTGNPDAVLANVTAAGQAEHDALRITRLVPESGVELVPDDTYILEAGFERLNGVDFRKGCYVGQEVTARMKHKTTLRKGLVRVTVQGDAAPGTPITVAGNPAGTLFSTHGGAGLAHLRLDRAGAGMIAGEATVTYEAERAEAEG
ncbi:MAG: folate-binding protein [Pseudomonadota bacterium]